MKHTYMHDCIVIGAGAGGLTVARGLSRAKKKVLLVEAHQLGGDCTNVGCVPSKALLDFVYKNPQCGLEVALRAARKVRSGIRKEETVEALEEEGMTVLRGTAALKDAHTVVVKKKEYTAAALVVATGSRPQRIEIDGVPDERVITNQEFFELNEPVPRLVIVGGGYIGCELAEAAARAGTAVTILQRDSRLIPREEPQSSKLIEHYLTSLGVTVYCNAQVSEGTKTKLLFSVGEVTKSVPYTYVLTALGRVPNVESLMLDRAGIKTKRGIVTNHLSQTSKKSVYAIGDCVEGNPAFTHLANNEGRQVIRNFLFPWWKVSYRHEPVPSTLYTHLEVARVGETRAELERIYGAEQVHTVHLPASGNDRGKVTDSTEGFVIVHALRATGRILGGTVALPNAGEILPRLVQAVRSGESATSLSQQVFAYPTRADLLKRAADAVVITRLLEPKETAAAFLSLYGARITAGFVWATLFASFLYMKSSYGLSTLEVLRQVFIFVTMSPYGPWIYIALYGLRPLLFIPATILTFASGVLFGLWNGFFFTLIAETLSACVGYTFARLIAGKSILENRLGSRLADFLNQDLFTNLLITRFAFLPFDGVNFVCGALKVSPLVFVLTTVLGIIPGAFIFVLAGTSVDTHAFLNDLQFHVDTQPLLLAGLLLVLTLLGAKWLKRTKEL